MITEANARSTSSIMVKWVPALGSKQVGEMGPRIMKWGQYRKIVFNIGKETEKKSKFGEKFIKNKLLFPNICFVVHEARMFEEF